MDVTVFYLIQVFAVIFFFIFWLFLSFGSIVLAIESEMKYVWKSLVISATVSAQIVSLIVVSIFVYSLFSKMV